MTPKGPRRAVALSRRWLAVGLVCAALPAARAPAQEEGRRVYNEQLRVALDEQAPEAREVGFDAGGWFNFAYFTYNDPPAGTDRTLRQYELRGWASASIEAVHRFYVRGLLRYDDWNAHTNPKAWEGDDFQEHLERAWYQFDLGQMIRNQTGQAPATDLKVKVGREFATIGTAFVLSMPLDLVQMDLKVGEWEFMTLLGKAIHDSDNIDSSPFIATHQDRCFWGVQAAYNGFDRHRPFVYFLNNQDNSDPHPDDPDQEYEYTSRYVGGGSTGSLFLPHLRYQAELVGEWGRTYSDGVRAGRDQIEAMALDALLEYLFPCRRHPKVSVEYVFASGDSDRQTSSSATVGGNRPDTDDHAFNAFGFRDTGIAFAPRVSNLHMYSLGASFFPLEEIALLEKMELGSKVFFFHKAASGGPISDAAADRDSRWLGWEWDVYCNWRITSDLTWTIRYGAFQPGEAFTNDTCRQFLYTGVTFSF